jgi:DNA-directed RNA polymerase specialized sigma24 family protein
VQHLPFLRRYARALSGSQASGDAYVAATLESLIIEPKALESLPNQRVALYRLFTKIWNSVTLNDKAEGAITASGLAPEQHITQITPRPRQAFLLVALEGFSEDEAAQILDVDLPTLRGLVEESGRELAAEIATDVLIIEDETFLTGQRPEPAFLIAKPFQLAVVSAVASQALFFGRKARPRERQAIS